MRWGLALLVGAGLLLAHGASSQLNDLSDTLSGLDRDDPYRTCYGVHAIEHGLIGSAAPTSRPPGRWIPSCC